MRYVPAKPTLAHTGAALLGALGERLCEARLLRGLTAVATAEAASITRPTLDRAEQRDPAVTMGTYLKILKTLKSLKMLKPLGTETGLADLAAAALAAHLPGLHACR